MAQKILVVEDDKTLLEMLQYNLERQGYDVLLAEDGRSGLKIARENHPDLLLPDPHNATRILKNPQEIERAGQLEWVIHNMKRVADRMINICEYVIYMATGVYQEIESEYEAPPVGAA